MALEIYPEIDRNDIRPVRPIRLRGIGNEHCTSPPPPFRRIRVTMTPPQLNGDI
jgi:hypothetical protein